MRRFSSATRYAYKRLLEEVAEKEIEKAIKEKHTSGEKLPPYLRLPEKAIANSITLKVSK